eukprot:5263637-Pyramimonas_sp.AAC.1
MDRLTDKKDDPLFTTSALRTLATILPELLAFERRLLHVRLGCKNGLGQKWQRAGILTPLQHNSRPAICSLN